MSVFLRECCGLRPLSPLTIRTKGTVLFVRFFPQNEKVAVRSLYKKAGLQPLQASFDGVWWQLIAVVVLLAVVLLHHLDQVDNLVAVANLVVIPRNHLHELVGQVYTSVGIED